MAKTKIQNLKKRQRQERLFKNFGRASIAFAMIFLLVLFAMILSKSKTAFIRSEVALEVDLTGETAIENIDFRQEVKDALRARFPEVSSLSDVNLLYQMVSKVSNLELKKQLQKNPNLIGEKSLFWFKALKTC